MTCCFKIRVLCFKHKRISFLVGLFSVSVVLHPAHSHFDKGLDSRMKFHLQLLGLSGIFTSRRNVTSVRPHTPFSLGVKGVSGAVASFGPCGVQYLPEEISLILNQATSLGLYIPSVGQSTALKPATVLWDQEETPLIRQTSSLIPLNVLLRHNANHVQTAFRKLLIRLFVIAAHFYISGSQISKNIPSDFQEILACRTLSRQLIVASQSVHVIVIFKGIVHPNWV